MFTQAKVRIISDYTKKVSGDVFGLQAIGGDIGNGVRYFDCREQLVWLGSRGSREAASYYLGVIDAFNPGIIGDLPADVLAVREELNGDRFSQAWYDRGMNTANYWLHYRLEDHTFSLAALQAMQVIGVGHTDNIVLNTGVFKVALSRMTVADGAPYDHQVTIQKIRTVNGRNEWVTVREYEAK